MAFMQGWEFVFAHRLQNDEVMLSVALLKDAPLISVNDLFKDKTLSITKTYFVVKEGVYWFCEHWNQWQKANK